MKTTPYWWEDAPREQSLPSEQPAKVDVAVVGAGFSGLCTALVLARAGLSVTVYEAGILGEGASSRNGGMVGPSFHKLGIAGMKAQFGEAKTNDLLRESLGFIDFIENFLNEEKIDADFRRSGRFLGASKPADYENMTRQLESLQNACGVDGSMVPKSEQMSETSSDRFFGGLLFHQDGGLQPAKYHNALVARVRESGARILPQTPVESIEKKGTGYQLKTRLGTVTTDKLAVCTNGYTGKIFPELRRRVLPLRSAMIATEELAPDVMVRLMPKNRIYGDSRRLIAYYRPSPDGRRVLFGGRASGLKDNAPLNARLLQRAMVEIYPELAQTPISHVWSGLVAYSFDHAPHIGQQDGLYYAMGYCGSGVARSSYFGHKLGNKILGRDEDGRTAFDDLPFQTKPFYSGNPWFMPFILNWHRMADRLGF